LNTTTFRNILKSEIIPEILKSLSLATVSIRWIEQWAHIDTDISADCHKGSVGVGFSCPGYYEGRVAMGEKATDLDADI
jgi:hypothetical protein